MLAIIQALAYVLGKFVALAKWIGDLAVAVFKAAWDFATDCVCWAFEQVMGLVTHILSAFDFTGLASVAGSWAGLPAGVIEVLAAVGVPTAVGMIVTALGIRLLLQLVPFTRLGS
jgi:hypothetical protein